MILNKRRHVHALSLVLMLQSKLLLKELDKFVVEYRSVKEDDMIHSFHMGAKEVRV